MNLNEIKYGGLGARLLAGIIDIIILALPIYGSEAIIRSANPDIAHQSVIVVAEVLKFLIWWVYIAGFTSSVWQATPGMRILNLKLETIKFEEVKLGRASLRYLLLFPSVLLLFLGVLCIAFNRQKRGLHDFVSGTIVTKNS